MEMKWTTVVNDLQKKPGTSLHRVLAAVENEDYFYAGAVFTFDASAAKFEPTIEVPLTPSGWFDFAQNCAGHELILTGGERVYHTYANRALVEHDASWVVWRSESLWRASDEQAYFSGGNNQIASINANGVTLEKIAEPKLSSGPIHGLHPNFKVTAGNNGVMFIHRGQGWKRVDDVPTLDSIINICCVSDHEIYICAGTGGLFRWDGDSNWHRYHTDPNAFIYSACRYQNRVYVSSLENHAYWLDGDQAMPVPESTIATQFKTDGELLFGLGRGKFEVFDGSSWRMYELDLYKMFPKELEAMYAQFGGA